MAVEKKNVYKRLSEARELISKTPSKKEGRNAFAKYDYFTPSQVIQLVSKACKDVGLLTVYKLTPLEGDNSYGGRLSIHNIDDPKDVIEFLQPTISPEIKATNAAQKIGGMVTYNERYLKMSAFDIVDNNLDFDAQDNTKKPEKKKTPPPPPPAKESLELTDEIYEQMKSYISKGKYAAVEKQLPNYKECKHVIALDLLIGKAKLEDGEGTPK